jgi:murein DD-endopeptidase MepM/ murein hydrolase activator NlpD
MKNVTMGCLFPAIVTALAFSTAYTQASVAKALRATIAARAIQPGELLLLTATSSRPLDVVHARAFGKEVPAFEVGTGRWQALIGIDVDVKPGRYTIAVDAQGNAGAHHDTIALAVRRRVFGTRTLKVDPAFVSPPPEVEPRIQEEARMLGALWADSSAPRLWSGRFVPPVPGRSSSRFGALSIFNGEPRNRHSGEDFASPEGTPIVAPNSGRVALAGDLYFSGNTVVIDHGVGLFSLLAHLSAIDVKQGEDVAAGQRIGLVGATGRVTGPHLHWAVRLNGARIDPSSLLATLGRVEPAFHGPNRRIAGQDKR